jgi:uncharacterized protein
VAAIVSAMSVALYHLGFSQYLAFVGGTGAADAAYESSRIAAAEVNATRQAAEAQESYRVLLAARLAHMSWFYRQPFSFLPGATLTLFIAGLLLVRHGVFEEPNRHARLLATLTGFGLISWLAANWLLERWSALPLLMVLRDQWLTFAYVSVALLLLARWPGLATRLAWAGTTGRMALTNYLLQIAALDLLFSGYAMGLGQVRPVTGLALALGCFAVEVLFSAVWLARFQFGPAEWLWRALTYGARPPLRRTRH